MADDGLYILMLSIHGLVRSENMELGRDADTGGQVKYVVELAKALGAIDGIRQVDLATRLIVDPNVSKTYAQPVERVEDACRIVRIQCGGRRYIRKERLWPHLDEFVDKTIKFLKREPVLPDIVHGHYADAGYVAMQLADVLGIPFVFTGHSLGRAKKAKLLGQGMAETDIVKKYRIDHRIQVEEKLMKYADLVIASTQQEVSNQYGLYRNGDLPTFRVLPPGIGIEKFYPYYHDLLPEKARSEAAKYAQASLMQELNRFFMHPDKPLILALCRPDKRKNIDGLVRAYGEDHQLQAMANLAVFAGIRKDISAMEDNERDVLTQMLLMMDKYDLYGKMAIPKKHDFEHEVPELYRIAAEKKGVFVNVALTEPFGITLLEASAVGLPVVATCDGGPRDIIENCGSGLLVDPGNPAAIGEACRSILADPEAWDQYSRNGILKVRQHYTWQNHAKRYAAEMQQLTSASTTAEVLPTVFGGPVGKRLLGLNYLLVSDIDNTLLGGDSESVQALMALLHTHRETIGFAVATGRTVESGTEVLKANDIPFPDVMIASVGSEIYYGPDLQYGQGWQTHISHGWDREKILDLLAPLEFLTPQEPAAQRRFKISYLMEPGDDRIEAIHQRLSHHRCGYNLVYSHQRYLDILPHRASKGKAIRYLSYKWEIPLGHFLVCGDSGNDEEMLRGEPRAVVVGNFSPELKRLRGMKNVYFAKKGYAAGILEGMAYYRFIEQSKGNPSNAAEK
jgi:sucrose-phosphate synthase